MMQTNESHQDDRAFEREEVLFGRVVDREATPDDWVELERLGDADSAIWARLARAERAHARLCTAVEDAIAIAECVDLPRAEVQRLRLAGENAVNNSGGRGWGAFIRRGAGWALAACLSLLLGVQFMAGRGDTEDPRMAANTSNAPTPIAMQPEFDANPVAAVADIHGGTGEVAAPENTSVMRFANYSPEDLWSGYVRRGAVEGRVLREMPAVVVEVLGVGEDGMYEVLVERRVLERRRISATGGTVMRVSVDEFGQPVMVPVEDGATDLQALFGPRESPI